MTMISVNGFEARLMKASWYAEVEKCPQQMQALLMTCGFCAAWITPRAVSFMRDLGHETADLEVGPTIMILDEVASRMDPEQVGMILGHELGHLALGHVTAEETDRKVAESEKTGDTRTKILDHLQIELEADAFSAHHLGGKAAMVGALEAVIEAQASFIAELFDEEKARQLREFIAVDPGFQARLAALRS